MRGLGALQQDCDDSVGLAVLADEIDCYGDLLD